MIKSFLNSGTEDVYNGKNTKNSRKLFPSSLLNVAVRKLDQLDSVTILIDLNVPPGNRLLALTGNRKGQFSLRINEQYRICFCWTDDGPSNVEITDYH